MFDPLSLVAGAGLAAAGYAGGARARRRARRASVPKPVCGCKHHKSYHENGSSKCSFVQWFSGERCKCKKYVGPQPLPEYYANELGE